MLVLMWQVIGRLVRGGVPARVVFVDSAFTPRQAALPPLPDTPETSLLHSARDVLQRYLVDGHGAVDADHRFIVRALYQPLWQMLDRCLEAQSRATRHGGAGPELPTSA
jgi:hypothetical protein